MSNYKQTGWKFRSGNQSLTKEPLPESASVVTWYVVPLFPPVAMAPNPTAPANAFCAFTLVKRAAAAEAKRELVLSIMAIPTKATIAIIKDNSRESFNGDEIDEYLYCQISMIIPSRISIRTIWRHVDRRGVFPGEQGL